MNDVEARQKLGARLRELREEHGYTLADLGGRLGIDASGLSRMERGERGIDTLFLRDAAEVFGVGLDAFFPATAPEVVLARAGGVDDARMQAMVGWAADLQRDIELVTKFGIAAA